MPPRNLCGIHEALRVAPAMAAGLTDHVWSLAELLNAAFAAPPAPPVLRRRGARARRLS